MHPVHRDRGQQGAQVEADEEAAKGKDLHGGAQSEPANGSQGDDGENDDVNDVHDGAGPPAEHDERALEPATKTTNQR